MYEDRMRRRSTCRRESLVRIRVGARARARAKLE